MIELPLDQAAEAVLDDVTGNDGTVLVKDLTARLKAEPTGMVADLVSRLSLPADQVSVDRAVLLEQANREGELYSDVIIRCEYLLLGWLRSLGDTNAGNDLENARAQYQLLRADWAFSQYEKLTPLTMAGF